MGFIQISNLQWKWRHRRASLSWMSSCIVILMVHRKHAHADLYLHGVSHRHPAHKIIVLSTLVCSATGVSDLQSLQGELELLKTVLQQNGYALHLLVPKIKYQKEKQLWWHLWIWKPDDPLLWYCIYQDWLHTWKISTLFWKSSLHQLGSVKDDLGLRMLGVYKIPCICGLCYTGQTRCTILKQCKQHQEYIRLNFSEKSVLAEHYVTTGHEPLFQSTSMLNKTWGFGGKLKMETLEIQGDRCSFNRHWTAA